MRRLAPELLAGASIVLLCLWVGLPRYLHGIDLGDEGLLAYGAVRVLEGQQPNRDFVTLHAPLEFYAAALAFELLGTSLASLRLFGLALHTAIALLVYGVTRQLAGIPASLAAALPATAVGLPYFLFVPHGVWLGVALCLLAVALLLRQRHSTRPAWAVGAGIATALAALARHDQGVYLAVSVLAYGVLLRLAASGGPLGPLRTIAAWAAGGAAVALPLAIYWLASGAAEPMIRQLVLFPLTTYARTSAIPMPWFDAARTAGERWIVAAFYAPMLVLAATALWLLRRARGRRFCGGETDIAFVGVLALLFLLQVLTRSDLYHLLITLPPLFVLCGMWSGRATEALAGWTRRRTGRPPGDPLPRRVAGAVVLAGLASLALAIGPRLVPRLIPAWERPLETLRLERGGLRLARDEARRLGALVRRVSGRTEPGQPILALPYHPMFYFLARRHNPTRWDFLRPGDQSAEDHRELIAQARRDPPALVLLAGADSLRRHAPAISSYLDDEYRVVERAGALAFLAPRAAGPAR